MKGADDLSTPTSSSNSRPSRVRKKRNFEDFEVDFLSGNEASFITSTPLPSVPKKTKGSRSPRSSDMLKTSSGQLMGMGVDEKGLEFISSQNCDQNETTEEGVLPVTQAQDSNAIFDRAVDSGREAAPSSSAKRDFRSGETDTVPNAKRSRGRPRKNLSIGEGDIHVKQGHSLNNDNSHIQFISQHVTNDSVCVNRLSGNTGDESGTPDAVTPAKRGRGRPRKNWLVGGEDNHGKHCHGLNKDDSHVGVIPHHVTTDAVCVNNQLDKEAKLITIKNEEQSGNQEDVAPVKRSRGWPRKNQLPEKKEIERQQDDVIEKDDNQSENGCVLTTSSNIDSSYAMGTGDEDKSVSFCSVGQNTGKRSRGRPRKDKSTEGKEIERQQDDVIEKDDNQSEDGCALNTSSNIDSSYARYSGDKDKSVSFCSEGQNSGKRSRGRPRKNHLSSLGRGRPIHNKHREGEEEKDNSSNCSTSKKSTPQNVYNHRDASCPLPGDDSRRKSSRIPTKRLYSSYTNEDEDAESDSSEEFGMKPVNKGRLSRGRGRGRQTKKKEVGVKSNEVDGGNEAKCKKKMETLGGSKSKGSGYQCSHCENFTESLDSHKRHMMTKHALVASAQCLQGAQNPRYIIQKLGYVACPKCGKKFKNSQYYNHHLIWCGREHEKFVCPVCHKVSPAMWEYQHMNQHSLQERQKKASQEWKIKLTFIKKEVEDNPEGGVGGSGEGGEEAKKKTSSRKAARNAITLITNLKNEDKETPSWLRGEDEDEDEYRGNESSSSSSGDISGDDEKNESGDGDDTREEEEEEEGEGEEKLDNRTWRPGLMSEAENSWMLICRKQLRRTSYKHVTFLYKLADEMGKVVLFKDVLPAASDWSAISGEEREKYLSPFRSRHAFVSVPLDEKTPDEEPVSLSWGRSAIVDGKSFCFTGGPVWAMEWCPLPPGTPHPPVLALASDTRTDPQPGTETLVRSPGLLQFWTATDNGRDGSSSLPISRLAFAIAHDSGYVRSMAWCPVGGYRSQTEVDVGGGTSGSGDFRSLARLGLLVVGCSDSSVLVYTVPQTASLSEVRDTNSDPEVPVYHPTPTRLVFNSQNAQTAPCLSVSWQGGDRCRYILGGFGGGRIFMWDFGSSSPLLRIDTKTLRPVRFFGRQNASILSISWCPSVASQFASTDADGAVYLWDVDHPNEPLSVMKKGQRAPTRAICWASPVYQGLFSVSDKKRFCTPSSITQYFISSCQVMFHGAAKTCPKSPNFFSMVFTHSVCTWDVTFHPLFEIVVTCDAIGNVTVILPDMRKHCTQRKNVGSNFNAHFTAGILYRVKPATKGGEGVSGARLTEDNGCASDNNEHTDKHSGHPDLVVFKECLQSPNDLAPSKKAAPSKLDIREGEDITAPNTTAVNRVRLCPTIDQNIWLASAGQSGFLRLDNLAHWVKPYRKKIFSGLQEVQHSRNPDGIS